MKVAGTRGAVEECFQAGKNEAGLDHYQVRLYRAWYRHVTLAMLALAWLAVTRAGLADDSEDPSTCPWTWTPSRGRPGYQPLTTLCLGRLAVR